MLLINVSFYKENANLFGKCIKFWTNSQYFHCEIEIPKYNFYNYTIYAVRNSVIKTEERPDFGPPTIIRIEVPNYKEMIDFCETQLGKKYDIYGIFFSQIFNFNKENKNKWFCSEFVVKALQIGNVNKIKNLKPNKIDPGELFSILSK
jgi:hypothetical protein